MNTTQDMQEQRRHERFPADGKITIYTSVSKTGYTVSVQDISQGGAFIRTRHLPQAGEEITFDILDQDGNKQYTGLGQVVWVHGTGTDEQLGFAIQLDQKLTPEIEQLLRKTNDKQLNIAE